jgi:hypothetical protein
MRKLLVFLLLFSGLAQAQGLNTDPSKSYLDPFKKTLQNAHREKMKAVEDPQELQSVVTRLALPGAVRRKYASRLRRQTQDFFLQNTIRQIQKWEAEDPEAFPNLRQRAGRGTMRKFEGIRIE